MTGFPKPLAGLRIIDLSLLLPGPYATMTLRSFGAEIIKLEPPTGDPVLRMSPEMHRMMNRGKTIERIDLKTGEGQARLETLVKESHALVEGFRPGVLHKLGFSNERLHEINPSLVIASISGYGASGPYRDHPAHDMSVLGIAGYYSLPSQIEDIIARPRIRLADFLCGQSAAMAIFAAMVETKSTGTGQIIDTSLFEATAAPVLLSLLSRGNADAPAIEQGHVMADSAPFTCACGGHICIATLEDKYWQGFVDTSTSADHPLRASNFHTRAGRDADKPKLAQLLSDHFLTRTRDEWAALAHNHNLPLAPMWRGSELLSDPQLVERGLIGTSHDEQGEMQFPTFPAMFNGLREAD